MFSGPPLCKMGAPRSISHFGHLRTTCRHNAHGLRRQGPASGICYVNKSLRRAGSYLSVCALAQRFPPQRLGFSAPPPLDACSAGPGGPRLREPLLLFFEAGRSPTRPLLWALPQPRTAPRRFSAVRHHRSFPRKSVSSCGVPEQPPKTLPSAPEEPRPLAVSGNSRGSFPPSVGRVLPKRAEKLRAAVLPDCWRRPQRHVGCSAR